MNDPALWSRSKRFFLAATFFGLLALKFRAALAAGIDLPAQGDDWLFPTGWNALLTARNGQWDPFLLRLFNSIFEASVACIAIALIARCCRPSNGGGWAVLLNGGIQLVLAAARPPALVESWRQPWCIALICGLVLVLGLIRRIRIAVLAAFVVAAAAAWWTGALRPPPREYPAAGDPRGAAVRRYLNEGNPGALPISSPSELPRMKEALAGAEVRSRLPLSARAALPFNQPLESSFAYIAVSARRTNDEKTPAAVSLRLSDGQLIASLQGELPPDREWHRLNLPVPKESFTLVASGPIETGPAVEYSAGSRDAGKLLRLWPLSAVLALICLLGGLSCLLIPNERHGWKLAWKPRERRVLPWLALAAYAAVLAPYLDTYAGGSDSAGYLGSARLLQHFQLTAVVPMPADLAASKLPFSGFVPRGFALSGSAGAEATPPMVPTYPPGVPLLFCLALWGLPAAAAIPAMILFHLLAGIVLTYLLARLILFSRGWALGAAAMLALCPIYIFMGLQPMSDVPALVWITGAALLALLAARRSGDHRALGLAPAPAGADVRRSGSGFAGLAFACGIVTAVAVLTRPANVIALPVIAFALPRRPRAFLFWLLGGLPFAVLEALYNHSLYGHAFLTGYGSAGGLFGAEWLGPTVLHYLKWLPALLTPAVSAILLLPFRPRLAVSARWLLVQWIALFLAFYALYSCTHETWWYLRFLLPALPPLIIGALLVIRDLSVPPTPRLSRRSRYLFASVVALCIGSWLLVEDGALHVLDSGQGNRSYADSSLWLAANAPANALVVCSYTSGALYYYSHGQSTFFQPSSAADAAAVISAAAAAHRPLYAQFFKLDQQPLAWFSGGHWSEVHRSGDIIIWRWIASA